MADSSFSAFNRNVLVLFAHPSPGRSEVNGPMARAASGIDGVTLVDLYAEYPDFRINVDREQKRLLDNEVIVFQHPLYWYSTPAILKESISMPRVVNRATPRKPKKSTRTVDRDTARTAILRL